MSICLPFDLKETILNTENIKVFYKQLKHLSLWITQRCMFISSKIGKWFDDFVFKNCRDVLLHLNGSFLCTELKISSSKITVHFILFYRGFDIFSYPTFKLWLIVRLHRRAAHILPIKPPCHSAACNQRAQQKIWTAQIPHFPAPTTIIGIKEEMST